MTFSFSLCKIRSSDDQFDAKHHPHPHYNQSLCELFCWRNMDLDVQKTKQQNYQTSFITNKWLTSQDNQLHFFCLFVCFVSCFAA